LRILRDHTIRRQVVTITCALLVPFIAAAGWSAYRSRIEHADELRDQAAAVAATAGAYLNNYLTGLDSMASALTRHPAVMALDTGQCDPLFEAVLSDQPLILNIVVTDTVGTFKCTGVPTRRERAAPAGVRVLTEVVKTGRPQVSELLIGQVSGQPTIVQSYPVRNAQGATVGVLGLALNLTRLQTLFHDIPLPDGSTVTLTDALGRVIARSRDAERYIGKATTTHPTPPREHCTNAAASPSRSPARHRAAQNRG